MAQSDPIGQPNATVKQIEVDFLILGSGIAGLYAAYLLSFEGRVLLITKADLSDANTTYAQGGIASVLNANDSFKSHISDTLEAGAGLCDPKAVEILVTEGPEHIAKLIQLGTHFAHDASGQLDLRREGGHSQNRIAHVADFTGREIENVLIQAVTDRNVEILTQHSAVELITRYHLSDAHLSVGPPTCFGAYVYDRNSWNIFVVLARATILATGGAGQVYFHNTNSTVATGDGVAMAYRAGAAVANMEFYQFHPTALFQEAEKGHDSSFLISEALRGSGAILRGWDNLPFMSRYDPRGDLAPRDIVARAIDVELKRSGAQHVWLDATQIHRESLMKQFPNIYSYCLDQGIDISRHPIPVVPAAHYMCGGVLTDHWGRTSVHNLFALGEVACTGVHGGNRLASNSLLEGLVFAGRIDKYLSGKAPIEEEQLPGKWLFSLKSAPQNWPDRSPHPSPHDKSHDRSHDRSHAVLHDEPHRKAPFVKRWGREGLVNPEEWVLVQHNFDEIQRVMWDYVGIVRSNLRLGRAMRRILLLYEEIEDFYRRTVVQNKILELRNLALVARLIVESALMRKESRGLHFSVDYAESRTPSTENTVLRRLGAKI